MSTCNSHSAPPAAVTARSVATDATTATHATVLCFRFTLCRADHSPFIQSSRVSIWLLPSVYPDSIDTFYLSFCFTLGLATLVFSVYFPFILSRFIHSWPSFLCPPFYDRLFPVVPLDASAISILFVFTVVLPLPLDIVLPRRLPPSSAQRCKM